MLSGQFLLNPMHTMGGLNLSPHRCDSLALRPITAGVYMQARPDPVHSGSRDVFSRIFVSILKPPHTRSCTIKCHQFIF